MKKITVIALSLWMTSFMACETKLEVPQKVMTAFENKFSDVKKIEWEQEGESEWEAEFKINGTEYSAKFNTNGDWLETESELKVKELPEMIRNAILFNYKGFEIEEVENISTPEYENHYEIEIKKDEVELIVDENGTIIFEEKQTENED